MPCGVHPLLQTLRAPGEHRRHGVDVDGGVGDALQHELLVDDVLACERGINLKEIELKDNVVDRPTVLDEQLLDGGAEQLHGLAHVGSGGVEVLVDL